jgi:hypothetical protein
MTTAPYDPRSGNTPDAETLDVAGMRYQAQAPKPKPVSGLSKAEKIATADEAATAAYQASLPKTFEEPLSQTEFDKLFAQGETAGLEGDVALEEGDAAIVAAGGKPLNLTSLNPDREKKKSAYTILFDDLNPLGLGSLVETVLKPLIEDPGISEEQFTTSLRKSDQYKKRFAANEKRVAAGFKPLSEAAYIALEDQYQNVMRNYGLPDSYYAKGEFGVQQGFEKLIANNVASTELEERIMTAQDRVLKSNPQVLDTLKQFYPGITNGDILAYTLDPANAIKDIQRKVTAAEIGGAAAAAGLSLGKTPAEIAASEARAQMLAGYGVNKEAAMSGFQTVADFGRGGELASFYNRPTYNQMEAEQEVFKLEGATAARKKRSEITGLEKATFGGQSGLTSGALARDRAGGI